ncbi:hypothetical protein SKAU_G00348850 [Synaphobranchus kaupii]|uniref:Uncharacterized protein n=1 Tax=Synaphobranchus kaupii TaxID=118154 RepID=A0A9Q1EK30_SYNKA|nr:hypothetical protein SKAU_G00348850 [Synaphobranchus kaupii]
MKYLGALQRAIQVWCECQCTLGSGRGPIGVSRPAEADKGPVRFRLRQVWFGRRRHRPVSSSLNDKRADFGSPSRLLTSHSCRHCRPPHSNQGLPILHLSLNTVLPVTPSDGG